MIWLDEYLESRIDVQREIIRKQTPKLPDMVASSIIDVAEAIIEELELLRRYLH